MGRKRLRGKTIEGFVCHTEKGNFQQERGDDENDISKLRPTKNKKF